MPTVIVPAKDPLVSSSQPEKGPQVDVTHKEYDLMVERWAMIRDTLDGEAAVKAAGTKYLPKPNASDNSAENNARYAAYVTRAQFYESTQRTMAGLVGQVFALDPIVVMPNSLKPLIDNADGNGVSLESSLEQATSAVVAYGRCGVFTDYPKQDGPTTVAERDSGQIRPNIIYYSPFSVINWRIKRVGAVTQLALVVLSETHEDQTDAFETKYLSQWKVLQLDDNNEYFIEVYRRKATDSSEDQGEIELVESYYPTDAAGKRFNEIPFSFIGSLNNNEHPDKPPLEGIASLNIGHYRNSADYEEACFVVGQPTVWAAGLDRQWISEVFKDQTLYIGSRAVIPLPANGSLGIIQAQANSMPLEAMKLKEKQMTALGAKLIEPAQVQRTLGEKRLEEASSASILVTCVKNVQAAYLKAFEWAKRFHGETGEVDIKISTDFAISRLDPNERVVLLNEWISGGITTNEYRTQLRKAGIAEDPDNSPEIKKPESNPASQPKL